MAWNYSAHIETPHGKAVGVGLPMSTKQSIEVVAHLRGKSVKSAKLILTRLLQKEEAIPFKKYVWNTGHKPGIATGRYPIKAGGHILEVLESAVSNASAKGLSEADLYIAHINAQQGRRAWRGGRKGRVRSKSTHIEIIVVEGTGKMRKALLKKTAQKKPTPKTATKSGQPKKSATERPVEHKEHAKAKNAKEASA